MGQATSGELGGNDRIIQAWQQAMKTVVVPDFQVPMLQLANLLIEIAGFNFEVKTINEPPVSIEVDATKVLTINEQREVLGYSADTNVEDQYLNGTTPQENEGVTDGD